MDDENSSRTSRERPASARPKYPSLRHKTAFAGPDDAMSSLRVVNVFSPREEQPQYFTNIDTTQDDPPDSPTSDPDVPHYSPSREDMSSRIASPAPGSVLNALEEREDEHTSETLKPLAYGQHEEDEFGLDSFNLKAPPPGRLPNSIEEVTNRFFSADHLNTILRDQLFAARFTGFLENYQPQHIANLKQYAETQKVIKAIEYANATARQMSFQQGLPVEPAAKLSSHFEARKNQLAQELVDEALPAHLTHQLVSLVTDTLVKEITGTNSPIMHDLIPSLAEVYCISDPALPDNPIVYASEGETLACY